MLKIGVMRIAQSMGLKLVSPWKISMVVERLLLSVYDSLRPKKSVLSARAALTPLPTGTRRNSAVNWSSTITLRKMSCPMMGESPFSRLALNGSNTRSGPSR